MKQSAFVIGLLVGSISAKRLRNNQLFATGLENTSELISDVNISWENDAERIRVGDQAQK